MKSSCFILLTALVLLYPCRAIAQVKDTVYVPSEKPKGYDKKKRQFAYYCINKLKGGALLVMLHTRESKAQLYRSHNAPDMADKILVEQSVENLYIANAFRTKFNFCKVYFFFDTHMDEAKKGVFNGFFLNDSLKEDPSITLKEDFYMVADFGVLEAESFAFPQEGGQASTSASGSDQRCLIMRDSYFVQMRPPFPFFVFAGSYKNADKQVSALDAHLKNFYDKHIDANPVYPFEKLKGPDPAPGVKQ